MAQEWEAEQCSGNSQGTCGSPEPIWTTNLTVHGLWPNSQDGSYPATCTNEAFNDTVPEAIGMDTMTTSWPNVPLYVGDADYDSFWTHEWSKHGTCASAYTQQGFFEVALATHMSLGTPALITENTGGSVDAGDLMEAFGGDDMAIFTCKSGYLYNIYTCWNKNSDGTVGDRFQCPSAVVKGDASCPSTTIKIGAFSS